jgi:hypothetical protein
LGSPRFEGIIYNHNTWCIYSLSDIHLMKSLMLSKGPRSC